MSESARSRRWMSVAAVLAFAVPFALHAQTGTVAGKVTDASTRQPIADVRVVIPGTALETQTNRDGDYRLVNVRPGRITVGVFRLGYRATSDTVRIAANAVTTHNIVMTA